MLPWALRRTRSRDELEDLVDDIDDVMVILDVLTPAAMFHVVLDRLPYAMYPRRNASPTAVVTCRGAFNVQVHQWALVGAPVVAQDDRGAAGHSLEGGPTGGQDARG